MHCSFQYFSRLCCFLSYIDSMWVPHQLDHGWNEYMCWAMWWLWSLSHSHTHAESGQMSYRVEIRLIWRRSSLLRIKWNQSLSTYHLQSILGKSFILTTQLQSAIFSIGFVLFVPHYRLPLNSVHSTSIERQEGHWEKKMDVDWQSEGAECKCKPEIRELIAEMGGEQKIIGA